MSTTTREPRVILGISCFYHDAAACLLRDGEIVAAAQEERFTRKKHDADFPKEAVDYCLSAAGIGIADVDLVAFYDKPFVKFERILETYLSTAPRGFASFLMAIPQWLKHKLFMRETIARRLGFDGEILFAEHHESHAASAFYPSPFQEAAVLTLDGVGEWATSSWGVGSGNDLQIRQEMHFPHSLGLLYSTFTHYTGFKVNSGEYKLMGLAPYGEPKYVDLIREKLLDLKEDGSFQLNLDYFGFVDGLSMTNARFHDLFGGPPRRPETPIEQRHMDLARSIQEVTEEIVLRMARHVRAETSLGNLCMAGGVALNCVANGKIVSQGIFDRVWIQPASGDAGGALGAALSVWYKHLGRPRTVGAKDAMHASRLGPAYSDEEVEAFLKAKGIPYRAVPADDLADETARLIEGGNVIGWVQGRMEFGPRALGSRSIIGDPRSAEMQTTMNLKIKFRESFRPFAPAVLRERVGEFFDLEGESPYMLLVAPVNQSQMLPVATEGRGLARLKEIRSRIPAVTHVDGSARVQTVVREDNPLFYDVIESFGKRTGVPLVINTSFNVRGEPIVRSPEEAYTCFMRTGMDYLIVGRFILDKKEMPQWEEKHDWRQDYVLD
jgi:carbamoyltransferase